MIPFCDLTGTGTASEYKYQPIHTLTPQLIELVGRGSGSGRLVGLTEAV